MVVVLLSPQLVGPATTNIIIQLVVFLLLGHLPCFLTGRMSYVDLAWPWGLVSLALPPLLGPAEGQGWADRRTLVALAYLVAGLRMGLGAVRLWREGHLEVEMPRYLYQRLRWAKEGITEPVSIRFKIEMQKEIFVQCVCNMGVLAYPLLLQGSGYLTGPLTPLEVVAWVLWLAALAMEHRADLQKKAFVRQCARDKVKNAICEVGLWRYSRHPNYFFEWMVWCCLVLSSLPSLLAFCQSPQETAFTKVGMCLGLCMVVHAMYSCLVYYTGAVPAEHYSVKKRPEYLAYQKRVNMFFPGPRKE